MIQSDSLLENVAKEVRVCKKCGLWRNRKNAVPGEGPYGSRVMLVGEAPGRREDESGRPFVGSAGKKLDGILKSAGLSRDEVFITNVVKCRTPENRPPSKLAAKRCSPYLRRQIEALNPSLVLLLGVSALSRFFPSREISTSHGEVIDEGGRRFLPTYHPAAIIYNPSLKKVVNRDLRKARRLMSRQVSPRS